MAVAWRRATLLGLLGLDDGETPPCPARLLGEGGNIRPFLLPWLQQRTPRDDSCP